MARIKSKNTKPEMLVRKLAHKLGYRFRLHRNLRRAAAACACRPSTSANVAAVDGADAARFLTTMKSRLEDGNFESDLGL